eukprot:848366-Pelagomonas_calceolata.AAC.2
MGALSCSAILQDWTRIVNEESQGLVEIKYRTGLEPAQPPNVQAIQRQMAIVAWQPGPNRILHVPSEVRCLWEPLWGEGVGE